MAGTGHPSLSAEHEALLATLASPFEVQRFLDSVPYSGDPIYRCPRRVLEDRKAHCFDGAVFAAAALRRLGFPPLLLDQRAVRDDDHVLALFRQNGRWGAIAKSNFSGLRFREPVYRSLRELVMSYFEAYFNIDGEKTLRAYSLPLRLERFDRQGWETDDRAMEVIAERLDRAHHIELLSAEMERTLSPVDRRSLDAGLLGVDEAGLYRPPE
ncbi:MAG: transglutaminase-like domain-containing protein [Thermoanaerobaculales bacterium]|nr:transglutaminase-like domain-containing protein [Thermoanaerobaculales bacterium]